MSFSYSGNPLSSPLDWVRFEIQDTDPKAPLLTDGEVLFCIEQEAPEGVKVASDTELLAAAARALEALARRFAAQADTQVGSLRTLYSRSAEVYAKRSADLRNRIAGMRPVFIGGLSRSERDNIHHDLDRVQSLFRRGQFVNP